MKRSALKVSLCLYVSFRTYLPLAPHTLERIKSWFNSFLIRFCWKRGSRRVAIYSWDDKHCFVRRHWRCQRILFPAGFNGIWYFSTIGLKRNLDFILSGSGSAGNEVTGGLPYTAGVTIGDIEGVNGYCSQLVSMAYGTSPFTGFWFCWAWGHRGEGIAIGNIEGVKRYCFHRGSVAYQRIKSWFNSFRGGPKMKCNSRKEQE